SGLSVDNVSRQYLNHGHEAMFITDQVAAPLFVHEGDRDSVAKVAHVRGTFSRRHMLDADFEVIPTPGHTPGHQSLVVETSDGTIVLAGQALQSRAEWEGATEPSASGRSSAPDPHAYERSVERLRALEPVRVHFAHDPAIWERG
ncbi:MAG: MBL fold metallo-hydrolase, partial [Gaiellales bacterium]